MITVRLTKSKNKYILEANGHAGYDPGHDIVCAAVSMLTYTLASRLLELGENINKDDLADGHARIVIRKRGENLAVLKTVWCGFESLADEYPDYVQIDGKCE